MAGSCSWGHPVPAWCQGPAGAGAGAGAGVVWCALMAKMTLVYLLVLVLVLWQLHPGGPVVVAVVVGQHDGVWLEHDIIKHWGH